MYDLYVECSRIVMGHIYAMLQEYLLGAYASNVKCMHSNGHGHIVHCIELYEVDIQGSYNFWKSGKIMRCFFSQGILKFY